MVRAARVFVIALLLLAPAAVQAAWVPGSGDVDRDGRAGARDAALIIESLSWPDAPHRWARGWREACDVNGDSVCDVSDAYAILLAAITDWNDYDSDGVPNDRDCAPLDDRLATPHTYYADADLDHIGNTYLPVTACTAAPQPPLVPWDGDPDDTSPLRIPFPPGRGTRLLAVDLNELAQAGAWRDDLARELGVDATPLRLDWNLVESSPGVFDGPQADALRTAAVEYTRLGLRVALAVSPIASGHLVLPPDLRADVEAGRVRLNDSRVIDRYRNLLTFVHGQLQGVPLVFLQVGFEVDRFLSRPNVPAYFWSDYGEFVLAASRHAKALWGSELRVGVTATSYGLLTAPTDAPMRAINTIADVVSATYVPQASGFGGTEPSAVRGHLQQLIATAYPKPVYLEAVEYPALPAAGGSETRQSQFVRAVFDIWDQYGVLMPYVCFGRLHDRSPERAASDAARLFGSPAVDAATLASTGLRTWAGEGRAKAAYQTLRNLAFDRGFSRATPPATRSFDMGFTPALYDAPPDAAGYVAMLDWIYGEVRTDGTLFNLHLDSGVPWLEAAADDFSWPEPPYSPYLRASWLAHKQRIPAGHKLLVSVNPTGVPRDVLAPYFGVGEGFVYNERFERVGDGVIADFENRLPPPPWNSYAFDHPDVKRAFASYCRRVIQYFSPQYLIIAIETTATMHEDPDAFARLVSLIAHVRADLKSRPETRDVMLMVSLSATSFMVDEYGVPLKREEQGPGKRELQIQGVLDLAPYVDGFALSLYPHYSKWNSTFMLASMFEGLWDVLRGIGKPVGFSETGWPAEFFDVFGSPFFSDAEKQARFLRLLISEAEHAPVPVEFLVQFRTRDGDLQWQRLLAASQLQPPRVSPQFVEFYKYFRDIGLFDGDGRERPATAVWREHLARPYVPKWPQ